MKKIFLAAPLALLLAGCATVTKGTGDDVNFTSTPDGATATADDIQDKEVAQSCITPCEMELNRKWTYDVTFEKEGFETQILRLEPKLSSDGTAGMAGNVLLGGVIGAAVDASTGAMNDLKPNPLNAVLKPANEVVEEVVEAEAAVETEVPDVEERLSNEALEQAEEAIEATADLAEEAVQAVAEEPVS